MLLFLLSEIGLNVYLIFVKKVAMISIADYLKLFMLVGIGVYGVIVLLTLLQILINKNIHVINKFIDHAGIDVYSETLLEFIKSNIINIIIIIGFFASMYKILGGVI